MSTINLVRTYGPMVPAILGIKHIAEKGHEPTKVVEFIDAVGGGMVTGILHSHVIFGMDLVKAAKESFPNQKTSYSVMEFIRRTGPHHISRALFDCRADIFAKGAGLGAAIFVSLGKATMYKKYVDESKNLARLSCTLLARLVYLLARLVPTRC